MAQDDQQDPNAVSRMKPVALAAITIVVVAAIGAFIFLRRGRVDQAAVSAAMSAAGISSSKNVQIDSVQVECTMTFCGISVKGTSAQGQTPDWLEQAGVETGSPTKVHPDGSQEYVIDARGADDRPAPTILFDPAARRLTLDVAIPRDACVSVCGGS